MNKGDRVQYIASVVLEYDWGNPYETGKVVLAPPTGEGPGDPRRLLRYAEGEPCQGIYLGFVWRKLGWACDETGPYGQALGRYFTHWKTLKLWMIMPLDGRDYYRDPVLCLPEDVEEAK